MQNLNILSQSYMQIIRIMDGLRSLFKHKRRDYVNETGLLNRFINHSINRLIVFIANHSSHSLIALIRVNFST